MMGPVDPMVIAPLPYLLFQSSGFTALTQCYTGSFPSDKIFISSWIVMVAEALPAGKANTFPECVYSRLNKSLAFPG